jgi:hypothetical protein
MAEIRIVDNSMHNLPNLPHILTGRQISEHGNYIPDRD